MAEPIFNQWVSRIVHELERGGPQRFNALERALGAPSSRMLSKNLKQLERDALIERKVLKATPPAHVVYSLTELGRELSKSTSALMDFWRQHQGEIRERRFVHTEAHRADVIRAEANDTRA